MIWLFREMKMNSQNLEIYSDIFLYQMKIYKMILNSGSDLEFGDMEVNLPNRLGKILFFWTRKFTS